MKVTRYRQYITHYAIAYDVSDSKRLMLLNGLLRQFCFQQQKSFFEGELTPKQSRELQQGIKKIINPKKDNVIIYPLFKYNILHKKVYGKLPYRIQRVF